MGRDEGAVDLRALTRRPWSTFLWCEDRPLLLRLLFGLAKANDPAFFWVDLRDESEKVAVRGPVELGWIPEDHLYLTRRPEEARPQDALGNLALSTVVRSDEPSKVLVRLADFMRLPRVVQEVVARLGASDGPRVVAVANADRVRAFYPTDLAGVRGVIEGFLEGGVSPIIAAKSPPGEGRWAFDYVFEVRTGTTDPVGTTVLHCERAPTEGSFHAGEELPVRRIPELVSALQRE